MDNSIGKEEMFENFEHSGKIFYGSATTRDNTLRDIALKLKPRIAVEIGTYNGLGTAVLARICNEVYTFDIKYQPDTKHVWELFEVEDKINYLIITKRASVKKILSHIPFKFAFVDGNHTYEDVRKDFDLVKKCGSVLFHDTQLDCIKKFMDEIGAKKIAMKFSYWEGK